MVRPNGMETKVASMRVLSNLSWDKDATSLSLVDGRPAHQTLLALLEGQVSCTASHLSAQLQLGSRCLSSSLLGYDNVVAQQSTRVGGLAEVYLLATVGNM